MTNQQSEIGKNPFSVKTPENLFAEELVDLFVPYPEFEYLQMSGHQFLHGHRGSGKSMMLRMMSPDAQLLSRGCRFKELPYFGVYLSIKATELNAPEFKRLEDEPGGTILAEHVLTTKLLSTLFSVIKQHCLTSLDEVSVAEALRKSVVQTLFGQLRYAGWDAALPDNTAQVLANVPSILDFVIKLIDQIHSNSVQYIKRRAFANKMLPYDGSLLGFQDVLLPVVRALSESEVIPRPIYFLLDDADNLTEQQTQILNTWVSYRATDYISLKISTQLNYKTYRTTSGVKIEAPHDFSSINFTSVRTGSAKERYPQLVAEIVQKRLARYGISNTNPDVFFPVDKVQEEEIKKIGQEIKQRWQAGESGYRPADDAYRNARPEYIRRLSGISKQGHRYNYAGFDQLVHISSGIIRYFLEPAARMFTEQQLINNNIPVESISPTVQNQELRKQADQLLLQSFEDLAQEAEVSEDTAQLDEIKKLRNFVNGIGALFKALIMDESASQRRIFSFLISDEPPPNLKAILKLGIIHGYFYTDTIGAKNGLGRVTLYVLTRRLAPAFSLDPMGFSGYLSLKSKLLIDISERPQTFINRVRTKGAENTIEDGIYVTSQLSLLDGDSDSNG